MTEKSVYRFDRRKAVATLLEDRGDLLVVAGLGSAAYDVAAVGNEAYDFPLWGAMGSALMVGLGLAIAQPTRNVVVFTGDGEMLMGIGALATVGLQQPKNLRLVVLDNEEFGETGHQATHTAQTANIAEIAKGSGIQSSFMIQDESELPNLRNQLHSHDGPLVAVIKIEKVEVPKVLPPRDGAFITHRMRSALVGEEKALS